MNIVNETLSIDHLTFYQNQNGFIDIEDDKISSLLEHLIFDYLGGVLLEADIASPSNDLYGGNQRWVQEVEIITDGN